MAYKLNSIAIFCMLCSAAIPSIAAVCPQCSDCDKDRDKPTKSSFVVESLIDSYEDEGTIVH